MSATLDGPPISVVLIEDERQIRRFVTVALTAEGCQVHEADGVRSGLAEVGTRRPELVVLDLGLPDGDGLDVIRDVRGWSNVPILVLSARPQERDRVAALDAGADDYLTKPFGIAELVARVRALLRRARTPVAAVASRVSFGDVVVDFELRRVARAGSAVHLTPIEYRLLAVLIRNADRVLTHRQLLREVWGPGHGADTHYLRVYMTNLRRKLEADSARPAHFITEPGVGYRFSLDGHRGAAPGAR